MFDAQTPMLMVNLYEALKWWGPILGFAAMAFKVRKDIITRADAWANTLLNNHLTHIQEATATTVVETKKTNTLLETASLKDSAVAQRVEDVRNTLVTHQEKEIQVWAGILKTLAILEDRTSPARKSRARK